jgi:hypothetical protein
MIQSAFQPVVGCAGVFDESIRFHVEGQGAEEREMESLDKRGEIDRRVCADDFEVPKGGDSNTVSFLRLRFALQ